METRGGTGLVVVFAALLLFIARGPTALVGLAGFLWLVAATGIARIALLKAMGVSPPGTRQVEKGTMRYHPIVGWMLIAALTAGAVSLTLLAVLFIGALVVVTFAFIAEGTGVRTSNTVIDTFLHSVALDVTQAFLPRRGNRAAELAMRRTGNRADRTALYLLDVGLLVYHGEHSDPRIYRLSEIPTDATHIRPFAVLYQPHMEDASGQGVVRFNLIDENWRLRYTSRAQYLVKTGENFITPKTWLPLNDQQVGAPWTMEVNVGDRLLGVHEFGWLEVGGELRAEFNGEGELDEKRRRWAELSMQQPVSVDALLEEQGEESYEPQMETGAARR